MISGNRPIQTSAEYERVDLTVQPSSHPDGLDLPLNDMPTLRFFFNLGVQRARDILSSQQLQHPPTPPASATHSEASTVHHRQLTGSRNSQQIGSQSTEFKEERDIETAIAGPGQLPIGLDTPSTGSSGSSTVSSSASCSTAMHPSRHHQAFPSAPCTNPMFSHSECRFTRAFHLQAESRRRHSSSDAHDAAKAAASRSFGVHRGPAEGQTAEDDEEVDTTAQVEPALMVAYLNESLCRARRSLQHRGLPVVSTVDANGLQVDFSARPIDSIFQLARAKTEQERCRLDNFSLQRRRIENPCLYGVKETTRMNGNH